MSTTPSTTNFTAATLRHRNGLRRGNVVKISGRGMRGEWVVTKSDYRKGIQVAPYVGRIESRNLAAANGNAPVGGGAWFATDLVTHVATR